MATATVYYGKDPESVKIEIPTDQANNIELTMGNGAVTVAISNINYDESFRPGKHTLPKDTYQMHIDKIESEIDPQKPPFATIKY